MENYLVRKNEKMNPKPSCNASTSFFDLIRKESNPCRLVKNFIFKWNVLDFKYILIQQN